MRLVLTGAALGLALTLTACGGGGGEGEAPSAPVANVPPPAGQAWSDVVSESPQGGIVMGNPNAPVKVVEFASMTCGACARFAEEGFPKLVDDYVKSGRVSFEMRNFVRDPADLAAAMLARCNGPAPFFPLSEQMFASQAEWLGRLQSMPPALQQQLQTAEPAQAVRTLADQAGLVQFVQQRGVAAEKAQACLADQASLQKLVDMGATATREHDVTGTPTFLINNRKVEDAANWGALEPKIRRAVGG